MTELVRALDLPVASRSGVPATQGGSRSAPSDGVVRAVLELPDLAGSSERHAAEVLALLATAGLELRSQDCDDSFLRGGFVDGEGSGVVVSIEARSGEIGLSMLLSLRHERATASEIAVGDRTDCW